MDHIRDDDGDMPASGAVLCLDGNGIRSRRESGSDVSQVEGEQRWKSCTKCR